MIFPFFACAKACKNEGIDQEGIIRFFISFIMFVLLAPAAAAPRLVVQRGHSAAITSFAFSPDGRSAISGSEDSSVKLWDVASGRELATFGGHASQVLSLAYAPGGAVIASGGWDGALLLRDVRSGAVLQRIDVGTWVSALAFSPDGASIAAGMRGGEVRVWDVASGRLLQRFGGHTDRVTGLVFGAGTLASVSLDGGLRLWEPASGKAKGSFAVGAGGLTGLVALQGEGVYAVAALDHTIRIWDSAAGSALRVLRGHTGGVHAIAAVDQTRIVSLSSDHTIKAWNSSSGALLESFAAPDYAISDFAVRELAESGKLLAVSPAGLLAWGQDGHVALKDKGGVRKLEGAALGVELVQYHARRLEVQLSDGSFAMWGLEDSKVVGNMADGMPLATATDQLAVASSNEKVFASWGLDSPVVSLYDADTFAPLGTLPVPCASKVALSADGRLAAVVGGCGRRYAVEGGRLAQTAKGTDGMKSNDITLWDVASARALGTLAGHDMPVQGLAFAPDGLTLVSGGADGALHLWDVAALRSLRRLDLQRSARAWVDAVAFAPDGKLVAASTDDGAVELWEVASGKLRARLLGHASKVKSLAFAPDGAFLLSASADRSMFLWRVADGAHAATLLNFDDGRWAVTDPAGRFDAPDLESISGLQWVMPDAPLTPLPLEAFMKDYYEPRLLHRILSGEVFKPVRDVSTLDRVQPVLRIGAVRALAPGVVEVNVEVDPAHPAQDLRLMRDGQLVGYADGATQGRRFRVQLTPGTRETVFSAYAFNRDGVKSATARAMHRSAAPAVKPRAWIVTVGVNRHQNGAWDLAYAANDARRITASLVKRLEAQRKYASIVSVSLVSDGVTSHATKANLKAVIDRLAGRPANLGGIANGALLARARPGDLLIISFSGHGLNADGSFYLIPGDTGEGRDRSASAALLGHAISSDELALWLRDVDAGSMGMIIDACQSAGSVGSQFKPGPMGARGLGQLAYEKGMLILAASQASENALESAATEQGLLSYALVNDGLEQEKADFQPQDQRIQLLEWFTYAMKRVPTLALEVQAGQVAGAARGPRRTGSVRVGAQQPALFDFTRGRHDTGVANTAAPSSVPR